MEKEQLSAMMDGETIDSVLLGHLVNDPMLQQHWYRYHLIRDALQKKLPPLRYFNIAERVASALEHGSIEPIQGLKKSIMPTYRDILQQLRSFIMPSLGQLGHIGLAAGVALLVLLGAGQFNSTQYEQQRNSTPVFNLLPLGGQISPVSYGLSQYGPQQALREQLLEAKISDYEALRLQQSNLQPATQKQKATPLPSGS